MKLLIAMSAVLFSTVSFADYGDMEVSYLSWCEKDQVVMSPKEGEIKVVADCAAENKKCMHSQNVNPHMVSVYAFCK